MAQQTIITYLEAETSSFDEKPFSLLDAFVLAIASYFLFEHAKTPRSIILDEELPLLHDPLSQERSHKRASNAINPEQESCDQDDVFDDVNRGLHALKTPLLVSAALSSIEEKDLSNLFWFSKFVPVFAKALSHSPRFSSLAVSDVAVDLNPDAFTQFAAMCFHVPDGSLYLSFRGTDSTITGWEEDFALSVLDPIPSQKYAYRYTRTMMDKWLDAERLFQKKPRHARISPLRLGGHSKGGNLAEYAAARCPEPYQTLITAVYTFDGPGVHPWQIDAPNVDQIKNRVTKIVPAHSVVGRIFDDLTLPYVVKSNGFTIMQHLPFSWEIELVDGDYSFVYEGGTTLLSDSTNLGLSRWIASLNREDRIEFCAVLFGIVEYVAEEDNIETLPLSLVKKLPVVIKHLSSLDEQTQEFAFDVITSLLGDMAESLKEESLKELGLEPGHYFPSPMPS